MDSLIVLGASVRALAFSTLRAGFKPYAVDLFADRDLAAICPTVKIVRYPEDFAIALADAPPARWIYTGGLENYPRLIDRLAKIRPLLGNSGAAVRKARNPARLGEGARQAGLPFPEIGGKESDRQHLLKVSRSSGGLGVRFATPDEVRRPPRGAYLQRYVEGDAVSAVFVAAGGEATLIGVTKQLVGRDFGLPRMFLYVGNVGPLALDEAAAAQLRLLGTALASRFELVGLFNVDLIRNDDGLWPIEINPRYSASVEALERDLKVQAVRLHVEACESRSLPPALAGQHRGVFGKAVVYAEYDGCVPPALEAMANVWNTAGDWPGMADLPRTGEPVIAGQPVVTVMAEAATMKQVEEELRRRVTSIGDLLRP